MRVSGDKADPGYETFVQDRRVKVLLDGDPQRLCITADEEQGFVLRYILDARGRPIHSGGEFLTEIVFGRVEIRTAR